ncbi:MAG: ABC transporter permease [Verrucomicrobia bacterium]|nr:ABC transporter permease [Verrucomicrobiota bacterium]
MLGLSGAFTIDAERPREDLLSAFKTTPPRIRLVDEAITSWDSLLLVVLGRWREQAKQAQIELDLSEMPEGALRLMRLAETVPQQEGAGRDEGKPSFSWLTRQGERSLHTLEGFASALAFLGNVSFALGRFAVGKARYRKSEFWVTVQACGPNALLVVGAISFLVGAILAFVGAVQLSMFGAEIFVANLVGIGMVMEMGSLMTGIILAGRTGASFAAQLGTMQVNEEIDALETLGIPPMEYLVLPRVLALAWMTPLLVLYANVFGIVGGGVVGVLFLNLSPTQYVSQTFELMTLWFCIQGLIKGSTYGILVALCGCYRGLHCGRSASAVGEAATGAVVSGIVAIVISDALWTLLFMVTG